MSGPPHFQHSLASPLQKGLTHTALRGGVLTYFAQAIIFLIQLGTQITLTRLLEPKDFGLLAMVTPVVTFATLFNDLGLSQATIQKQTVTQLELSSLFWLNTSISTAIACMLFAASPLVGWFYDKPETTQLTAFLSISVVFGGASAQHLALLNRTMSFGRMSMINVCAMTFGCSVGVVCAFLGLGYWSLAMMPMAVSFAILLLAWCMSGWRPSAIPHFRGAKEILRFGLNIMGFNLMDFMARNLDNILIGRFDGAVPLGFYDRAYRLMIMPLQQISWPISRVAIPLLSRLRETPANYRDSYIKFLQGVHIVAIPGMVLAVVFPNEVAITIFGQPWARVGPILFWLSLVGVVSFLRHSTEWLFISQGRSREFFLWGAATSAVYAVAFCIGLTGGAVGVAKAYALSSIFLTTPFTVYGATKKGPVQFSDVVKAIWPFTVAGAVSYIALDGFRTLDSQPGALTLSAAFILSYAVSFTVISFTPAGQALFRQIVSFVASSKSRYHERA